MASGFLLDLPGVRQVVRREKAKLAAKIRKDMMAKAAQNGGVAIKQLPERGLPPNEVRQRLAQKVGCWRWSDLHTVPGWCNCNTGMRLEGAQQKQEPTRTCPALASLAPICNNACFRNPKRPPSLPLLDYLPLSCLQAKEDVGFAAEGASRVSGTVYMVGEEHKALLREAYCAFDITNPMHADVFPSVRKMETEVVAMTAALLGGEWRACDEGSVIS